MEIDQILFETNTDPQHWLQQWACSDGGSKFFAKGKQPHNNT
jgi:hypothetical protein